MKNLRLSLAILLGSAILFSSCKKDGTTSDSNVGVNFDAAYVVNGESNSISVINLSTNNVDKTIELPQFQASSGMGMMGSGGMMNMTFQSHQIKAKLRFPFREVISVAVPI